MALRKRGQVLGPGFFGLVSPGAQEVVEGFGLWVQVRGSQWCWIWLESRGPKVLVRVQGLGLFGFRVARFMKRRIPKF